MRRVKKTTGMKMNRKNKYYKLFWFWLGFLGLHYAYEVFPIFPLKLISGINESFFQHSKIAFFSYLIVNIVEYLRQKKTNENNENFILTRLFSTMILPWFIFIIWYIAPAYYGRIENIFFEILYANIALLLSGYCIIILEQMMDGLKYQRNAKIMIIILFTISMSLYITFTFQLPWADVFADPYL